MIQRLSAQKSQIFRFAQSPVCPSETGELYFLRAPKFVRFLFVCTSPSLSSCSFSLSFFFFEAFVPVVEDGVPVSLNDADTGVGACEAGVPGVES